MTDSAARIHERRDRLATRLLQWLDETLDAESPPDGVAAEIIESLETEGAWDDEAEVGADWYGVQAALTALTQEVRLQSRSFARLSDRIEERQGDSQPLSATSSEATAHELSEIRARLDTLVRKEVFRAAVEPFSDEGVDLLLDMRDRLIAAEQAAGEALDAAHNALPAWWPARVLIKKSSTRLMDGYHALLKGYRMSLERLDAALAAVDVFETVQIGDRFDPVTMKIVDVEDNENDEEGSVLAVYRRGYRRREALLRPAEVKVARARHGLVNSGDKP